MNSLVDSDIQRFVACLVLGYLENQQLIETYASLLETSRHLIKEKHGLRYGNKPLDTSLGLVNIIRDYFTLKSRINEFLRICPQSSTIIRLIDTDDTLQRLEIILETFKDNLHRIEKLPHVTKKRKLDNNESIFDISPPSKTSTPEIVHPSKRLRKSLTTPFLTISANDNKTKSGIVRSDLEFINSSSDTSNKEYDDDNEDDLLKDSSPTVVKANPEQLSETFLQKPDFVEKVANIINLTRSAKEAETSETQENGLTNDDLNDIMSKTQNDPSFDDIVNDIVNKYLLDYPVTDCDAETSTKIEQPSGSKELPIKQRLRPRHEKKPPVSLRKKKINIISNEPYTGIVPEAANFPVISVSDQPEPEPHTINTPLYVEKRVEIVPLTLQSVPVTSQISLNPSSEVLVIENIEQSNVLQITETFEVDASLKSEPEKKESTPKTKIYPGFLDSKSKSTPRRKATHVRILNFSHTPSTRKLSMIRELSTPVSSGVPTCTPGSAPATISSAKIIAHLSNLEKNQKPEVTIDENSNSNSISLTPKVVKDRKRRKIAVSKSAEKSQYQEELKQQNMSLDDWFTMRKMSKDVPIDQQVRKANEKAEAEGKIYKQKRRTPKRKSLKKKIVQRSQKSSSKSPDDHKGNEENSTSIEYDENKPLIKFKIKSPRKNASGKKKKEKLKKDQTTENRNGKLMEHKTLSEEISSSLNDKTLSEEGPSSLNRSDTVQEVATMLTTLSETILAKGNHNKVTELLETTFKELNSDAETPLKDISLTPLPYTPRFAIPLVSQASHETPMPKSFGSISSTMSLVKICDIPTPSFPITPGIKETPIKDCEGSPTSASGYSSRRTDYSSCSSYYKPDESEDINNALSNSRKRSKQSSQSESDFENRTLVKTVGSVKKVECPGAIERVKSFEKELPTPHYTMMDEGLLSESMLGTATEDSSDSSSSFTCSTCSTDPSDEENTMEKLNKSVTTEVDSEWNYDEDEKDANLSPSVVNEKTGEVRFPLRNWITPKKVDEDLQLQSETNKIKSFISENDQRSHVSVQEDHERRLLQLKEVRQRTLEKIRLDSAAIKPKSQAQHKFRKSNLKTFKLPSEEIQKPIATNRKEQILQQGLTERPRPTPLKLIPSSSSRRKNTTPRKTIVIDELPRQLTSIKKKREKKPERNSLKNHSLNLENVNDNAIMPEMNMHASLNISTSFISFEDESILSIAPNKLNTEDGSNTFQKMLITQGFQKSEAEVLQNEFIDNAKVSINIDSASEEDYEEDALEVVSAETMRENEFHFNESEGFKCSEVPTVACSIRPMIINFDGQQITLTSSGIIEALSISPSNYLENTQKCNKKKNSKKIIKNEKEIILNNGKSSLGIHSNQRIFSRPKIKINIREKEKNLKNPSLDINSTDILSILDKLHGK